MVSQDLPGALAPARKRLLKNAEILCSWLDYKSINRRRTKVLKSLAKRPVGSKTLTSGRLTVQTWPG